MTPAGRTIATVWAHYDDDLLFANPAIDAALAGGNRVRSLFLTASDAGKGMSDYAAARETGIRAAYDVMLGAPARWVDRTDTLLPRVAVTVTAPQTDPRVELAFLRLPDGGLSGNGWYPTGYQTLPKLLRGELASIRTLDTGRELTAEDLVAAVAAFIGDSRATSVVTTLPSAVAGAAGDHPDHGSAGQLVAAAVDAGLVDGSLVHYAVGYPGAGRPVNLGADEIARKLAVFAAYAAHDAVLARDSAAYLAMPGFGEWLQRQYWIPESGLARPTATA